MAYEDYKAWVNNLSREGNRTTVEQAKDVGGPAVWALVDISAPYTRHVVEMTGPDGGTITLN